MTTRWDRREVLRIGAIGLGAGVPMVMTLLPAQARAEGSWNCVPGDEASAQGSWQCGNNGGQGIDQQSWQDRTRDEYGRDAYKLERDQNPEWVFPGGHEWRMRRLEEQEERARQNGEFDRFGSDEDWR